MCPHTTIPMSSYYYKCVLIPLCMCPHTTVYRAGEGDFKNLGHTAISWTPPVEAMGFIFNVCVEARTPHATVLIRREKKRKNILKHARLLLGGPHPTRNGTHVYILNQKDASVQPEKRKKKVKHAGRLCEARTPHTRWYSYVYTKASRSST